VVGRDIPGLILARGGPPGLVATAEEDRLNISPARAFERIIN
jgi:hypothetical protein